MAELFSDAGYATAMYGKWHLGDMEGRFPTDQGFDEWYGIANTTDESEYTSQFGFDPAVVSPPQIRQPAGSRTNELVPITDILPSLARVAGYEVPSDRIIDGVDQMPLFTGKTTKSAHEGFPVYNGDEMFAYKWRNFKVHYYQQDSMFDTPVRHNFPRVHNLLRDPKEVSGIAGGPETGAQSIEQPLEGNQ